MKALLPLILGLSLITGGPAMAIEEPKFTKSVVAPPFELRHYEARIIAEVTVKGPREGAVNEGFRLLAAYIFGQNTTKAKLAMTAPVTQTANAKNSESLAMTAPVLSQAASETANASWIIRFMMPEGRSLESLPVPLDPRVKLKVLPASDEAVVRFSGLTQKDDVDKQTKALMDYVHAHHWQVIGQPALARFDPPWTPWFMRRNEVMIPVAVTAKP